jgi:hypothetical protein
MFRDVININIKFAALVYGRSLAGIAGSSLYHVSSVYGQVEVIGLNWSLSFRGVLPRVVCLSVIVKPR